MQHAWAAVVGICLVSAVHAAGPLSPAETRRELLKIVAPRPAPLEARVTALPADGGVLREKVVFTVEPGQSAAMLVVKRPEGAPRRPAVLVLHGTRGRKEAMEPLLRELAAKGFVACATDARWHGELAAGDYEDALIAAYRTGRGHPWLYETVSDTLRALDYLETRKDVHPDRLGLMGISMGGMNTWLTAAVDPRVKVAVPFIGVTSFGYQAETGQHAARCATLPRFHRAVADALGEREITPRVAREAWGKLLPGILDRFDCPSMLRCIAPRPLLIVNGEKDERCPLEGVRRCHAAAEAEYRRQGAADRLRLLVQEGAGHQVTDGGRAAGIAWMERWLLPH